MLKVTAPYDHASRPVAPRWQGARASLRRVNARRPMALEPRLLFDGAAFALAEPIASSPMGAHRGAADASEAAGVPFAGSASDAIRPMPAEPIVAVALAGRLPTHPSSERERPQPGDDTGGERAPADRPDRDAARPADCGVARVETSVIATSAAHTDGEAVAIGEVVTFRTVITPGAGRSDCAALVQHLDDGLVLLGVERIDLGDCVSSTARPDPRAVVAHAAADGEGTVFEIDFGSVSAGRDDATIVVEFRARVDNSADNQQGRALRSEASFLADAPGDADRHGDGGPRSDRDGHRGHAADDRGGHGPSDRHGSAHERSGHEHSGHEHSEHAHSGHAHSGHERDGHGRPDPTDGTRERASDVSEALEIVEPCLTIEVVPDDGPIEPGEVATFTVTVRNQGEVDAFDVGLDDIRLPTGLDWRAGSFLQVSGPGFDVSPGWNADGETGDGPAIGPFAAGAVAVFRFEAAVQDRVAVGDALPVTVTVRYTSLPGDDVPAADCGDAQVPSAALGERTGFGGPATLDDYVASDVGSVLAVRGAQPVNPSTPGGDDGSNGGSTPGGGDSGNPAGPPPPAVAPPVAARPDDVDRIDDLRPPLLDVLPAVEAYAPIAPAQDLYASTIPDGIRIGDDLPAVPKGAFGRGEPTSKDDDCVPAKPAIAAVVKRAVPADRDGLAVAARKPPPKPANFSEQIGAEQRRFRPPAIVRPVRPPDC